MSNYTCNCGKLWVTGLDLKQIELELNQITPWPWVQVIESWSSTVNTSEPSNLIKDQVCPQVRRLVDSAFIAKSPERIAALVKRVRELEKALEFYADENNTVRPCMAWGYESSTFCANVDLCRLAQEVLKKSSGKE